MHYLSNDFIDDVYGTAQGCLSPESRIPGVRDLFVEGSPCDLAYSEMLEAYLRLLDRLNKTDEDPDVEIIINSFLTILRLTGEEMYRCGAEFALMSSPII